MRPRPRERLLRATLLLPEGVFAASATGLSDETRRLGPLGPHLEGLLTRQRLGQAPLAGVLGEARSYARQLPVLRLCTNELLPLLRASGRGRVQVGGDGPPIGYGEFRILQTQALDLLRQLERPVPSPESAEELAALVGAPCAILGGVVMPLSPVTGFGTEGPSFAVGGRRYALRQDRGRPLLELLHDLRRERGRRAAESMGGRTQLTDAATRFLRDLKAVLERFRPRDRGRYQLFYRDADHQLQHSRGYWLLVRGPVAVRTGRGVVFVGLALMGQGRQGWLAIAPRAGASEGSLWSLGEGPLVGGFCMGDRRQYQRLLSDEFTDSEAVVEWLDAGVILATGRSAQHRAWRKLGQRRLAVRRLAG